jgi:hypothetical protein
MAGSRYRPPIPDDNLSAAMNVSLDYAAQIKLSF